MTRSQRSGDLSLKYLDDMVDKIDKIPVRTKVQEIFELCRYL